MIAASGFRARDLTSQLLAFARCRLASPRVVDIVERIRAARPFLERVLGERVVLDVRAPETRLDVLIDPAQFEQVLLNLLSNAPDAMPGGGRMTITAEAVGVPPVLVRVRFVDTGVGMAPEVAERAFEPFFTTKETGKGTGLGLATVYGIVRRAGGEVRLTSAPDAGATFEIDFPRAEIGRAHV